MTEYRPGVCNIGASQRRQRLREAAVGFLGAGAMVAAYDLGALPGPLLVAVFVPLVFGVESAIEAYESFCVRFALAGRYDFRGDGGTAGDVATPADRRDDRLHAAVVTAASVVVAGVVTAGLVVLL